MTRKKPNDSTAAPPPARAVPSKTVPSEAGPSKKAAEPRAVAAGPPPKPQPFKAPKPLASFVPGLTKAAFEKFGFSAVALITDWPGIVGRELAAWTAPEKVKWPKPSEMSPDDDDGGDARRRGAVLHLRVEGPRALEIEYRRQEVADRINAYFGYRAISEVRILQAPLSKKPAASRLKIEPQDAVALPTVADDDLRRALERLGRGMKARARQVKNGPQKS